MTKRKKSLTGSGKESTTLPQSSIRHSYSPETLEHMRRCEAREWLRRYQEKSAKNGSMEARAWWNQTIEDIEKIRGKMAADELRQNMNSLR